jgi:hypothetical protein
MLRPSDLLVLLGLLRPELAPGWSVRSLATDLRLPQAAVQRSLARLGETPVYDPARKRVNRSAAEELFVHAVPFVAPGRMGAPTRGTPTAWAAAPLAAHIDAGDELPPVWPDPTGETRGLEVVPLHERVNDVVRSDPWMHEMLALVDAMRIGDARTRALATELLRTRIA